MKTYSPLALVFGLLIAACTSSQFATYHPPGATDTNWEITVLHKSGVTQNFKVVVNDSTVIDDDADFFSGNAEAKGVYRGREVKLMVTHSSGFLGIGEKYTAIVLISNELVGRFEF